MDDEGPDFDLQPNPLKKREGRFDTAPKAKKNPAPKAKWNPAPKAKQPAVAFESAPVFEAPIHQAACLKCAESGGVAS